MVNFVSLMCFAVLFFGEFTPHDNFNTTITGGQNNFTLTPYVTPAVQYTVDDLSLIPSETPIHFDDKTLPQNKVDKHLTEKRFELLRGFEYNVTNNDLNTDLTRLKNMFNITEDMDSKGIKLKLLNQTYIESLYHKGNINIVEYDKTTVFADSSYRDEITVDVDQVVYEDETTVNFIQYDDETAEYLKNKYLEVGFRKEDDINNSTAPKAVTTKNDNSFQTQTDRPQIKTSKDVVLIKTEQKKKDVKIIGATLNEGIDISNGRKSEMPTPTGKIIADAATISENKFDKSNGAPLIVEEDIAVIQRIKGIWIGGHCRCNYLIRSQAQKVNIESIFIVYIYFLLQTIRV